MTIITWRPWQDCWNQKQNQVGSERIARKARREPTMQLWKLWKFDATSTCV